MLSDTDRRIIDALQGGFGGRAAILAQLVARWAAYSQDGDMIGGDLPGWLGLGTRQADGAQHVVEQLARLADEGLALAVLLLAGRLADDHPVRARVADAEDGLRAYNFPVGQYALSSSDREAVDTAFREIGRASCRERVSSPV